MRSKESRFKMGKRVAVILMAAIMILSFQAGACAKDGGVYGGEEKGISVIADGERLTFSQDDGMGIPFIDSAGRVQAPVRKVLEKVGAEVSFETDGGSDERIISISKGGTMIRLAAGSPLIRVNQDVVYQLDTSPQIIESRTYMPLRAVLEALGYSVSWDGVSRTVAIEKNRDGSPTPSAVSGSAVTPVGQFDLPRAGYTDKERPEVIVNHGYIYYIEKNNAIMQTTFSDLTKPRKVYDCPGWVAVLFNDENEVPRFYYHTALPQGKPYQFILNTDGSMTELNGGIEGETEIYTTGGKTFAFTELNSGGYRLEMKDEEGKYVDLGETKNQYYYEPEINGFNGRRGVFL
ncbi:MAG TPA: copper amine oxidase N-terminal domain-containing protein, partial [Bacillota bacterium]|nr:copper amine oxidase N-terminal domain-containing protein [Bacillota bacterium]